MTSPSSSSNASLMTPLVKLSPLDTPSMTNAQLEAAMKVNPFDLGFKYANANSSANAAILQRTPSGTTITLVDDLIQVPNQSPALTTALQMLNSSGDGQVQTPDIIRRALQRASSNATSVTPGTADIVQKLLELTRDDSMDAPIVVARTDGSPPHLNSPPSANVDVSETSTMTQAPVMISVVVDGQTVQVPIRLRMQEGRMVADGQLLAPPSVGTLTSSTSRDYLSATSSRDGSASPRPRSHTGGSLLDDPDARRADVLQRNREAAVRYRKRKRAEQKKMADSTREGERERMSLEARVTVLQRELDQAHAQLRHFHVKCTCAASNDVGNVTTAADVSNITNVTTATGGSMFLYRDPNGRNILISADSVQVAPTVQPIAPKKPKTEA